MSAAPAPASALSCAASSLALASLSSASATSAAAFAAASAASSFARRASASASAAAAARASSSRSLLSARASARNRRNSNHVSNARERRSRARASSPCAGVVSGVARPSSSSTHPRSARLFREMERCRVALASPRATIRLLLRLRVGESSSSLVVAGSCATLNHRALAGEDVRSSPSPPPRGREDEPTRTTTPRAPPSRSASISAATRSMEDPPEDGSSAVRLSARRSAVRRRRPPRRPGKAALLLRDSRCASVPPPPRPASVCVWHERARTRALCRGGSSDATPPPRSRAGSPRRESRRRSRPRPGPRAKSSVRGVPPLGSLQTRDVLLEQTLPASRCLTMYLAYSSIVGSSPTSAIPGVSSAARHHRPHPRGRVRAALDARAWTKTRVGVVAVGVVARRRRRDGRVAIGVLDLVVLLHRRFLADVGSIPVVDAFLVLVFFVGRHRGRGDAAAASAAANAASA